mmetsp:Transcript_46603/g.101501  ORF Transcript_46603/g.101501 Transcript_46603/m.101501 type:complete len:226 (+) Transcript_46603:1443-2120(+)
MGAASPGPRSLLSHTGLACRASSSLDWMQSTRRKSHLGISSSLCSKHPLRWTLRKWSPCRGFGPCHRDVPHSRRPTKSPVPQPKLQEEDPSLPIAVPAHVWVLSPQARILPSPSSPSPLPISGWLEQDPLLRQNIGKSLPKVAHFRQDQNTGKNLCCPCCRSAFLALQLWPEAPWPLPPLRSLAPPRSLQGLGLPRAARAARAAMAARAARAAGTAPARGCRDLA